MNDKDDNNNVLISPNTVLGQTLNSNITQFWTDKENNAKIIFTYEPESPVIGNPTELSFNVHGLHSGNQLRNLHVRIIITNGQKIFKTINATSPNGDFSVNYAFPDSGSYQIISKIDSTNLAALTSFKVLVPPQYLSSGFKSFGELMIYYVTPITSAVAGFGIYLAYKKKKDLTLS
jgi:hypothetical protein